MESREAIALLVQATLVGSAAVALVLLVRQPLRRAFGELLSRRAPATSPRGEPLSRRVPLPYGTVRRRPTGLNRRFLALHGHARTILGLGALNSLPRQNRHRLATCAG